MTDCWMWDSKKNRCGGYSYNECPKNCKYKCTASQQLSKEIDIYDHLKEDMPFLYNDFVSMIDPGMVYIRADEHNRIREFNAMEVE